MEAAGWLNLYCYDESGFSLTSCLPCAWQKKGETTALLPGKGKRANVAGFYSKAGGFAYRMQQQSFGQQQLIELFDGFCGKMTKKTVVVLDNAPAHHGKAFEQKAGQWQEQDLYLFYLPAYAPELNRIEMIWKRIKYSWLDFKACLSFENLSLYLKLTLELIGKKYTVKFD